jgi:hypothetical protein
MPRPPITFRIFSTACRSPSIHAHPQCLLDICNFTQAITIYDTEYGMLTGPQSGRRPRDVFPVEQAIHDTWTAISKRMSALGCALSGSVRPRLPGPCPGHARHCSVARVRPVNGVSGGSLSKSRRPTPTCRCRWMPARPFYKRHSTDRDERARPQQQDRNRTDIAAPEDEGVCHGVTITAPLVGAGVARDYTSPQGTTKR